MIHTYLISRRIRTYLRNMNGLRTLLTLTVIMILLLLSINVIDTQPVLRNDDSIQNVIKWDIDVIKPKYHIPTVLFWTNIFSQTIEKYQGSELPRKVYQREACYLTSDKSYISEADAVVVHYRDMSSYMSFWSIVRNTRDKDQVWIIMDYESPSSDKNKPSSPYTFNWTMSYKDDATLQVPYGKFVPLTNEEQTRAIQKYPKLTSFPEEKRLFASAIISHCNDDAMRYKTIHELQKYIPIQVFGKCGQPCASAGNLCFSKKYKFRVVFENSHCKSYVTEKFWKSVMDGIIPIVNWRPTQKPRDILKQTYINVFDFPTLKLAALHIKRVSQNVTLYQEYLSWRHKYKAVENSFEDHLSDYLCTSLKQPFKRQTIIDYSIDRLNDTCKPPGVSIGYSACCNTSFCNLCLSLRNIHLT